MKDIAPINIIYCGLMDYVRAMKFQQIIHSQRVNNLREDTIIILEHPNTITLGRRSDQSHIITPQNKDKLFSFIQNLYQFM